MIFTAFALAIRSIRRHLLRSLLTVLGVVIGVASLVTLTTVGRSVTASVRSQVTGLGSNLVTIRPVVPNGATGNATPRAFEPELVEAIRTGIGGVRQVAPVAQMNAIASHDAGHWSTSIIGTDAGYVEIGAWTLAHGRNFDPADIDSGRSVCILGATVVRMLFAEPDPVGSSIRLADMSCTVIGVLAAKGADNFGDDQDDVVLMPLGAFQRRLTGNRDLRSIQIALDPRFGAAEVVASIRVLMRERRHLADGEPVDFQITDPEAVAAALSSITGLLTALLGTVAAVSLVVGGIGIMNVMLVSVTERTREIGVRLAIEEEVLLQFLVEAIVLAWFGGIIGLALAVGLSAGITTLIGIPFLFDLHANLFAFVFAGLLGAFFGFVPARRAAALNPIDALRHE